MKHLTVKVCNIMELEPHARKRAMREMLRQGYPHWEWWEPCYDAIRDAGTILGFNIPEINFSLHPTEINLRGFYEAAENPASIKDEFPNAVLLHQAGYHLAELKAEKPWLTASFADGRIEQSDDAPTPDRRLEGALSFFTQWVKQTLEEEYEDLLSENAMCDYAMTNDLAFYPSGVIVNIPAEAVINEQEVDNGGE